MELKVGDKFVLIDCETLNETQIKFLNKILTVNDVCRMGEITFYSSKEMRNSSSTKEEVTKVIPVNKLAKKLYPCYTEIEIEGKKYLIKQEE